MARNTNKPSFLRNANIQRALVRVVQSLFSSRGRGKGLVSALGALVVALVGAWFGLGSSDSSSADSPSAALPSGEGYALVGKIVEVTDGDTVALNTAKGRQRIRLASIDAPERNGRDRPGQPYGDESRQHLAKLVSGRSLTAQCFEQDRYERHICNLLLDGGQTANRLQVEAGMAWANQEGKGKFLRDEQMLELEQRAQQAKLGLWAGGSKPVRPWEWRYQCWQQKRCAR